MKLLLDTHLLLWAAAMPEKLSPKARALITHSANDLIFSAASLWEVAIKAGLGRADFDIDPTLLRKGLVENGYNELVITASHGIATSNLASVHKDPFDRILIAQAVTEGIELLTSDPVVARYEGPITLV